MAAVYEAFQSAGAAIAPLRSIDEIAAFFLATASVSRGVLNRAQHVAARCSERLLAAVPMVNNLLESVGAMPHVEKLLAVLPPSDGTMLMTDRSTCVVCGDGELLPMLKVERSLEHYSYQLPLYTPTGVRTVELCVKHAAECGCAECGLRLRNAERGSPSGSPRKRKELYLRRQRLAQRRGSLSPPA